MKMFDVECPVCGKVNRNLFLTETDGWFECERCSSILQDEDYCRNVRPMIWNRRFVQMDQSKTKATV